ncbi:MAG: hypothetical protein WA374_10810 [Acidobacteriaceae bacterium]
MYLSAADAILPAIRRTRTFLFQPFRLGTYLKLCLVALLTEGLGGNSHFSHAGGGHHSKPQGVIAPFHFSPHFNPAWIPAIVAGALLLLALGLLIGYLITRLRFAYFHCLIHNSRQIRPGWNLYQTQATRFFWMNVAVGVCFLLTIGIILLPFATGIGRFAREVQAGMHPDAGAIVALVLPLIPILILIALAALVGDIILRDFMLPHYALDNATAAEAWAAVLARIRTQKAPFFVYALLRIVLPIIGAILLFAILILPGIVYIAVVAMVEVGIHATLGGAGTPLMVLIGLISVLIAALVGICFGGPLSTATREYALIFYGGRYQRLGDTLFPPPAAPASA